jgi:predicted transcriptional regulator
VEVLSVDDRPDQSTLAEMTAEIVSAYVSHNRVAVSDVPNVIRAVAANLESLGIEEKPVPEKPEPAVSVRRSISPNYITCLICGKKQKLLKRHLAAEHNLTPAEYRELFDLRTDYPMVAPSYAQQRSELARRIGLGRPRTGSSRRQKGSGRTK